MTINSASYNHNHIAEYKTFKKFIIMTTPKTKATTVETTKATEQDLINEAMNEVNADAVNDSVSINELIGKDMPTIIKHLFKSSAYKHYDCLRIINLINIAY